MSELDLRTRVSALLGQAVPESGEAWSSAVESLHYSDEAQRLFDLAETLAPGPQRNDVLQQAHDALALAEDWELQGLAHLRSSGEVR